MSENNRKIFSNILVIIGLVIGVIACFLCWNERVVTRTENLIKFLPLIQKQQPYFISARPDFESGILALIVIAISSWRGILNFQKRPLLIKLLIFVVDTMIIATFFSMLYIDKSTTGFFQFLSNGAIYYIIVITVCVTMVLFGMKKMAGVTLLVCLFLMMVKSIPIVNAALGNRGYWALIGFCICFILQQTINLSGLKTELSYLYGKGMNAVSGAVDELERTGKVAAKIVSASTGVPLEVPNAKVEPQKKLEDHE